MNLKDLIKDQVSQVSNIQNQKTVFEICDINFIKEKKNNFKILRETIKSILFPKGYPFPDEKFLDYDVKFINCQFPINLMFGEENNIEFNECDFYGFIKNDSIVNSKIKFYKCNFYSDHTYDNITFNQIVDFWGSTFHKKVIFHKINFNDVSVFSSVKFKHNVLFTYSTFKGQSVFRHTCFEKGFDLSLSNILGPITFFELVFNPVLFETIIEKSVEEYEDNVTKKGIIPLTNKKETFRIIKHYLQENDNLTYSLDFLNCEMNTYRELLKNNKGKLEDRFILLLNRISNNYKSSWIRSSCFIIITGVVFYNILIFLTESEYVFLLNWDIINDNIKNYFEFINPTHKSNFLDYLKPSNGWFYFVDFLGKIFIGYGIYQFIQSFRKYKS